jgi:uncharacterized protein involved in exopolysaccharide biosynthesis
MKNVEQISLEERSSEKKTSDEISLIDLFAVLWQRKKLIITIVIIAMMGVVFFSILSLVLPPKFSPLPNKYAPSALMLINEEPSQGSGLSSRLASMGGIAAMAGINMPAASSYSDLIIYLVGTNTLLDTMVDEFNLISRYKIKKFVRAESRKRLKKILVAEADEKSGVLKISFTDIDPVFAQGVVNFCVAYLEKRFDELGVDKNKREKENLEINIANTFQEIQRLEEESRRIERSVSRGTAVNIPAISLETNRIAMELAAQRQVYSQLTVQYELLRVTMASERPVFQVLEYAEVPDQKSKPSRGMLCIIVTFAAGFFAVFLAFTLNAVSNIKNDPEAMKKFRGKQTEE